MKNIHLLPTDKPSRLIYNDANQLCYQSNKSYKNDRKWMHRKKFNIYITSDEEIKEGDYVVQTNLEKTNTQVIKCETEFQTRIANSKDGSFTKKKIILTTDPDLYGVQAIDDEFLEWFVKNPSCEYVETE
jgi:hypothetical protein